MAADLKKLRDDLRWSQSRMAEYLGCDQSTVSRIEQGAPPNGPIKRLIDHLAAEVAGMPQRLVPDTRAERTA